MRYIISEHRNQFNLSVTVDSLKIHSTVLKCKSLSVQLYIQKINILAILFYAVSSVINVQLDQFLS
jgi:hypothetical protein